jgi:hypothetical protein
MWYLVIMAEGGKMKPTMVQVNNWLQAGTRSGDAQMVNLCEFLEGVREHGTPDDTNPITFLVSCAEECRGSAQAFIDTFGPEPEA